MEEIRLKWSEVLQDLLECPICCELPKHSNVYQCVNGHHLCQNCRWKLMECPVCKYPFISTRNLIVEKLSTKFDEIKLSLLDPENDINKKKLTGKVCVATQTTTKTRFQKVHTVEKQMGSNSTNMGAEHSLLQNRSGESSADQNLVFIFSPTIGKGNYPCLIGDCTCNLPFARLMQHLKFSHSTIFHEMDSYSDCVQQSMTVDYKVPMNVDSAFFIKYMGLFFVKFNVNDYGDLAACVQVVNSAAAGKRLSCVLKIGSSEKSMSLHSRMIRSCRVKNILSSDESLRIKATDLRLLLAGKSSFCCHLSISRKNYTSRQIQLQR